MNQPHSSRPKLVFGCVGLEKGSGGIAELSRQTLKTLLGMHGKRLIRLEVHVLQGSRVPLHDALFTGDNLPAIHWHAGRRWSFASRLMMARADMRLLDHVGLARLPGLIPLPSTRPYMLFIHGVELCNCARGDYLRSARKARLLIANSQYTAEKARRLHSDLPEIRVCWPGKDRPEPSNPDEPQGLESIGQHAMLIVGRLSAEQRHKGHDHLLDALPGILQAVPDAQLIIAGEGDDRDRLEAKAAALKVAKHVVFTGWLTESALDRLYSRCALFVMPSEGDGFGLVFLEAMMHRLPCVGLKTGAAAEIFEDEVSGILIDREDFPAMAKRLSGLLLDPQRRKCLGEAGYTRYQSAFRHRHYAERLQSILVEHFQLEQGKSRAIAARVI